MFGIVRCISRVVELRRSFLDSFRKKSTEFYAKRRQATSMCVTYPTFIAVNLFSNELLFYQILLVEVHHAF